jgi:hypothetical protein
MAKLTRAPEKDIILRGKLRPGHHYTFISVRVATFIDDLIVFVLNPTVFWQTYFCSIIARIGIQTNPCSDNRLRQSELAPFLSVLTKKGKKEILRLIQFYVRSIMRGFHAQTLGLFG